MVIKNFQTLDNYIEESFGPRISMEDATEKIIKYINEETLPTPLEIIWCDDLLSSALMCSTKVDETPNALVTRKYTMLLKTNAENTYLRERGVLCLMDHEIGTHYNRSYNEGLQPWYRKRSEYGLTSLGSHEMTTIEEGFACINTSLGAKNHYLAVPALLYYGACMAEYLPFKELFEHLSRYLKDEEQCWKHCMRIKRCLRNQEECGGYGKDQRYFEGAVRILMEQNNIDFRQLIAGKLSLTDLEKVQEQITLEEIHLPSFMTPISAYQAQLREIARLNGLYILPKRERPAKVVESSQPSQPSEVNKDVNRSGLVKPNRDRQV
ncbi:unnamed protein product [Schistocephalus solidus]|uniref:EcRH n=1 Tax=Schistocephalus solidus TaxID=70667 RepID=A0A183SMY0_SCHSO|nr:unnamed protein product [Schistocephalus solidus]